MKHWSQRLKWSKIDPLLILVAMGRTAEERSKLYTRIAARFGTTLRTLEGRRKWLAIRIPDVADGPLAVERWEQETLRIAEILVMRERLQRAKEQISKHAKNMKYQLARKADRKISVKTAARMLRVPPQFLRWQMEDLQLLQRDWKGQIPLPELRRWYQEDGKWFLKSYRVAARGKYLHAKRAGKWDKAEEEFVEPKTGITELQPRAET